ncbi:S8 family serine peptidase [Shewanella maritima]|uniref:S8 family serine peptidase n=1 Tax=Shewanella maritima TaxID=2520507 RepID=UPI003736581A
MKFRKCTIAMCVTSAILSGAAFASVQSEVKSAHQLVKAESSERSSYTFNLQQPSALTPNSASQAEKVKRIVAEQDAFISQIKQIDPEAKVISRSHLLANIVTLDISEQQLDVIKSLVSVKHTFNSSASSMVSNEHNLALKNSDINTTTVSQAEAVELMTPYTGEATAGSGVSVAIISTGIDYTLTQFGGSGVYGDNSDPEVPPAAGSYLDALANGAIEYSGFPNDVVVGGWDFSSENYGNDANPIDQNLEYVHWNGWEYPTGMGTELASIVRQLAPGAELHAYKVYNVSGASWDPTYISAQGPTLDKIVQALEHALDPDQDGDMSDRIDVALLEASGAGAFFDIDGVASPSLMQLMIEKASAQGMTIVTHAGELAEYGIYDETDVKHRSWISHEGSPTSAITVGAVERDGESLVIPTWAPLGPVRGSKALKPELLTYTDNQPVITISNADADAPTTATRSDAISGAARIAAAAAVIKSHHPSFGPTEIKALLTNSAVNDGILESDGATLAELIASGHGVENVEAAIASPVVMWDTENHQPYLQFGMHEVNDVKVLHKQVMIKNVSDTAQSYEVAFNFNGDKPAHAALSVNLPQMVSVPANSSVVVPVTVTIDGNALPDWPLVMSAQHTDANLKLTELNGYITLTAEGKPELNLGWMVKARNNTRVTKKPRATEFPTYLGWNPETFQTEYTHLAWGHSIYPPTELSDVSYYSLVASFVNESKTETQFQAFPLLIHNRAEPVGKEEVKGHKIRAVGGGMFDDAMCTVTGKKISVAVNFFQPAQMSIANFSDKIGPLLFFYDLFPEERVMAEGWDEGFYGAYGVAESEMINQPFVTLNNEGQPTTYYIDYNKEYDWNNPTGRYTESSLPTYFANDGRNIVSQLCVEDLYHHELDSVEDFDQNLGFHIETDRDSGREKGEPIVQFNPVKNGYYSSEEVCGTDWFGNQYCETIVNDLSVHAGFAAKGEDDDLSTMMFSQSYTAQPGEEIYIASVSAPEVFGLSGPQAPKGFMVMSSNDDYFEVGYNAYLDDDGTILAKVAVDQMLMVDEDAEAGTNLGQLELDTQGFFSLGESDWEEFELIIVNTLPGTPFAIDSTDNSIYVTNPDALDFESMSEYQLKIVAKSGNSVGETEVVTIKVNNVNDIAPMVNSAVADAISVPAMTFKKGSTASFSVDVSGLFIETEGDALDYSVTGTGFNSLAMDGMNVVGELAEEGNFSFTVTATDGEFEASHSVSVNAEFEPEDDDGGSLGWLSLLLAGFVAARRRH